MTQAINHFEAARKLKLGESLEWHYAPLCNTMISECLNTGSFREFTVEYVSTNWEASQGYSRITRVAVAR